MCELRMDFTRFSRAEWCISVGISIFSTGYYFAWKFCDMPATILVTFYYVSSMSIRVGIRLEERK